MKHLFPILDIDEQNLIFLKELFIIVGFIIFYNICTGDNSNKFIYLYVPFLYSLTLLYVNYSYFIRSSQKNITNP